MKNRIGLALKYFIVSAALSLFATHAYAEPVLGRMLSKGTFTKSGTAGVFERLEFEIAQGPKGDRAVKDLRLAKKNYDGGDFITLTKFSRKVGALAPGRANRLEVEGAAGFAEVRLNTEDPSLAELVYSFSPVGDDLTLILPNSFKTKITASLRLSEPRSGTSLSLNDAELLSVTVEHPTDQNQEFTEQLPLKVTRLSISGYDNRKFIQIEIPATDELTRLLGYERLPFGGGRTEFPNKFMLEETETGKLVSTEIPLNGVALSQFKDGLLTAKGELYLMPSIYGQWAPVSPILKNLQVTKRFEIDIEVSEGREISARLKRIDVKLEAIDCSYFFK